jgi:hypothetical protein
MRRLMFIEKSYYICLTIDYFLPEYENKKTSRTFSEKEKI